MRLFSTTALLLALTALTGCGAGAGGAGEVPTITTRPSVTSPTSAPPTTPSQAPSTTTSAPPTTASTPTATPTAPVTTESGPSPVPPTEAPGGPSSYDDAVARFDSEGTGEPRTLARFATAKNVVYCLVDDAVIGPACELSTGFIKDDDVCGSDVAEGVGRIESYQGRPRPVCNSDTIREPGADVVADGAVVVSGDIKCLVQSIGVTCLDTGRHRGFFIGPREYHVF